MRKIQDELRILENKFKKTETRQPENAPLKWDPDMVPETDFLGLELRKRNQFLNYQSPTDFQKILKCSEWFPIFHKSKFYTLDVM